jgi:hypothetical protein
MIGSVVILHHNGITYEKEDVIFATKSKLFSIGTISLLENIESIKIIVHPHKN